MKNSIYITIVVALVVGVGAFFGGMKYQQSTTPAPSARFAGVAGARLRNGQAGGAQGSFVSGQILSMSNGILTLQLPNNGGSKIVILSSSTTIMKTTDGTASDLASGANVQITGTANSDGSVTAKSIQLRNQVPPPQTQPGQ